MQDNRRLSANDRKLADGLGRATSGEVRACEHGDVIYEAWHQHDHGPGPSSDAHYHLKVNDATVRRVGSGAVHAKIAIETLIGSLTDRIAEDQGE